MNIPIKKGMLIRHQGHIWFVWDVGERHTGKQRPTFHIQLREARDGRQVSRTLDELQPVEEVARAYRQFQYLYRRNDAWVFMDAESFDELELSGGVLMGGEPFLREGETYRALLADGQVVWIEMPENVALKVADTAPPTHAVGASGSVLKEATMENGLLIRVPLFIKAGDVIRVDTRDKTYAGKEN